MKKCVTLILLSLILISTFGQNTKECAKSPFNASIELTTKYMWRGLEYGTSPAVLPSLNFSSGGFNAFVMGAYTWDGSHQEVDLGFNYNLKALTFGVLDYYYPSNVGENDNYFNLKNRNTGHSVETYLTIASEKSPAYVTISTFIFGNDKKFNGCQAYSSYAEIGYTHTFNDNKNISLAIGAALNKSFYTDYEKGFNIVNIAIKYVTALKFGNFQFPISTSYIINPYREKSYFTFSTYFGF